MNKVNKIIFSLTAVLMLFVNVVQACEEPISAKLSVSDMAVLFPHPECTKDELHYGMCFAKDMTRAVQEMRSRAFRQGYESIVADASAYLDTLEPSDKKVITVDLDETLIDSSSYYVQYGKFHPDTWLKWLNSKAAGTYHKPLLNLMKKAKAKGFAVMFITGRPAYQAQATWKALSFFDWTGGFLKPFNQEGFKPSSKLYKSEMRKTLQSLGYEVVLNIGDQESDFDLPIEPEKGEFKLPNVMYKLY